MKFSAAVSCNSFVPESLYELQSFYFKRRKCRKYFKHVSLANQKMKDELRSSKRMHTDVCTSHRLHSIKWKMTGCNELESM